MLRGVLIFTLLFPALAFSYTVVRKDAKIFSGQLIQQIEQSTILKDKEGITIKFRADQIEKLLNAPLVTRIKRLSYAKVTQMEPIVRKLLGPRGSVIVDPRTNTLIITDIEKQHRPCQSYGRWHGLAMK